MIGSNRLILTNAGFRQYMSARPQKVNTIRRKVSFDYLFDCFAGANAVVVCNKAGAVSALLWDDPGSTTAVASLWRFKIRVKTKSSLDTSRLLRFTGENTLNRSLRLTEAYPVENYRVACNSKIYTNEIAVFKNGVAAGLNPKTFDFESRQNLFG